MTKDEIGAQRTALIEEAFEFVRNSEELGIGSLSYIDETFDDDELRDEIASEILSGAATVEEIFAELLRGEEIRQSRDNEMTAIWDDGTIGGGW